MFYTFDEIRRDARLRSFKIAETTYHNSFIRDRVMTDEYFLVKVYSRDMFYCVQKVKAPAAMLAKAPSNIHVIKYDDQLFTGPMHLFMYVNRVDQLNLFRCYICAGSYHSETDFRRHGSVCFDQILFSARCYAYLSDFEIQNLSRDYKETCSKGDGFQNDEFQQLLIEMITRGNTAHTYRSMSHHGKRMIEDFFQELRPDNIAHTLKDASKFIKKYRISAKDIPVLSSSFRYKSIRKRSHLKKRTTSLMKAKVMKKEFRDQESVYQVVELKHGESAGLLWRRTYYTGRTAKTYRRFHYHEANISSYFGSGNIYKNNGTQNRNAEFHLNIVRTVGDLMLHENRKFAFVNLLPNIKPGYGKVFERCVIAVQRFISSRVCNKVSIELQANSPLQDKSLAFGIVVGCLIIRYFNIAMERFEHNGQLASQIQKINVLPSHLKAGFQRVFGVNYRPAPFRQV